jgi:oligoribonuclease NrnB/cAMP/cGMP phosphodiesterase (DHH superfamily)
MPPPLVLYHHPCNDGHTAAWVARKAMPDAELIGVNYGQTVPDAALYGDRRIYILDFSYRQDILRVLVALSESLVVLDHHKTAEAELKDLQLPDLTCVFDMHKSGAMLAWEYFFPGVPAPFLVHLVQDRDLWRHALPRSRELNAYMATLPRTFEVWDQLSQDLDWPLTSEGSEHVQFSGRGESAVEQGAAVLRYQEQAVRTVCEAAREVSFGGHKVLAANTGLMHSDVAGKLAEGRPFGIAYYMRADGLVSYSLRSTPAGIDVSEVARAYGGGGHRHAAGCELTEWPK